MKLFSNYWSPFDYSYLLYILICVWSGPFIDKKGDVDDRAKDREFKLKELKEKQGADGVTLL